MLCCAQNQARLPGGCTNSQLTPRGRRTLCAEFAMRLARPTDWPSTLA